ncbi:hypothetical protein H7F51_10550 [Novosphingobium flavum]|uniref:Lipoprotein n=1 Tax=Novosphingobium flavum TaxID=1778672 RepID=A0A7X1KLU7_9SPHN|nr:hypothetical protein [Novosphingobium flavum]MBC2665966.1 hypothetical protein [Novosphingobium flavum]
MQMVGKCASLGSLFAACVGCTSQSADICHMPTNRHFWQGLDVSWRGEVIEVMTEYHGGGIYFTDYRCGEIVELDPDVVQNLYSHTDELSAHAVVAQFRVNGRLTYRDGGVVLRPSSLNQVSSWATDEAFQAYMKKRQATLIENGLVTLPAR